MYGGTVALHLVRWYTLCAYAWRVTYLCIVGCLPVKTHATTGVVIYQAIVILLCYTLTFVQVIYCALTKTMCSHHILQIPTVDFQSMENTTFKTLF